MQLWKKKSLWIGIALLLVLGYVTFYFIQQELGKQDVAAIIAGSDPIWLFGGILCMIVYLILDAFNIGRGLRISGYKVKYRKLMTFSMAGFFFSSVTPSSTGGQPVQLYYMNKEKIKVSHGTFCLLTALLCFQSAAMIWGVIGMVFSWERHLFTSGSKMLLLFPVGFAINLVIIVVLFLMLFSRRMARVFAGIGIWFSSRMKKGASKGSVLRSVASYRSAARTLNKNKTVFFKMLLNSLAQITAFHSIPYFAAMALGCTELPWLTAICTQGMLFISVSSLPLPGAAGITEYGYTKFFRGLIPIEQVGSTLILSRCINLIFPLILSAGWLLVAGGMRFGKKASDDGTKA